MRGVAQSGRDGRRESRASKRRYPRQALRTSTKNQFLNMLTTVGDRGLHALIAIGGQVACLESCLALTSVVRLVILESDFGHTRTLYEKSFNLKLSGNEVYCTNALLSLIKIMMCNKFHSQKVSNRDSLPKNIEFLHPGKPLPGIHGGHVGDWYSGRRGCPRLRLRSTRTGSA